MKYKGRECGPRKSKLNPDAYNKDELVELAFEVFGGPKSYYRKITKDKLCQALSSGIHPITGKRLVVEKPKPMKPLKNTKHRHPQHQ